MSESERSDPADDGGSSAPRRIGTWESLVRAMTSWRTASVVLLSFSSGMPLGLVWIAIPDWMRDSGVDIRIVGLFTLAQIPWSFNVLWAPLMDRFQPPFLGRRRGWIGIAQVLLFAGTLGLAGAGHQPETPWVVFAFALAIGLAAASQDIAIDAYAVDVLRKEEQGVAVGARIALYRFAMFITGGLSITIAGRSSWPAVCVMLALLYLPMLLITLRAPEPPTRFAKPQSLRQAIWYPFLGFLSRDRALEILAFVVFFKLADNFAQSLLRPFLVDMGYTSDERGFALATLGLVGQIGGAFFGGALTNVLGLGRALWLFGVLQVFSNVGYLVLANIGHNPPVMFAAMGFETLCQGLGTGAFSVLLLRMTQKRFSATQYALFSTLFGFGRIFSGPVAGFTVDAVGWSSFFVVSMVLGIPGLVLLHRFVPFRVREPTFEVKELEPLAPLSPRRLLARGVLAGALAAAATALLMALLGALRTMRAEPETGFDLIAALLALLQPGDILGWIQIAGLLAVAASTGILVAAYAAARRGAGRELALEASQEE